MIEDLDDGVPTHRVRERRELTRQVVFGHGREDSPQHQPRRRHASAAHPTTDPTPPYASSPQRSPPHAATLQPPQAQRLTLRSATPRRPTPHTTLSHATPPAKPKPRPPKASRASARETSKSTSAATSGDSPQAQHPSTVTTAFTPRVTAVNCSRRNSVGETP